MEYRDYFNNLNGFSADPIADYISRKGDKMDNINKNVDRPEHYDGTKCIENMQMMFGRQAVKDFCRCNAYKYRYRAGRKDGNSKEQDIAKAEWYEDYLSKMDNDTKKESDSDNMSEQERWRLGL